MCRTDSQWGTRLSANSPPTCPSCGDCSGRSVCSSCCWANSGNTTPACNTRWHLWLNDPASGESIKNDFQISMHNRCVSVCMNVICACAYIYIYTYICTCMKHTLSAQSRKVWFVYSLLSVPLLIWNKNLIYDRHIRFEPRGFSPRAL